MFTEKQVLSEQVGRDELTEAQAVRMLFIIQQRECTKQGMKRHVMGPRL